jgi:signal peptidase
MWVRRLRSILSGVMIVVTVAVWAITIKDIFGFRVRVVLSDSMSPQFRAGSIIVSQEYPYAAYQPGDIVLFNAPVSPQIEVAHRIVNFFPNRYGLEVAATKGDHNSNGDPWTITRGNILGKVILAIPFLGYVVQLVRTSIAGFTVLALVLFFLWVVPAWMSLFRKEVVSVHSENI